MKKIIFNRVEAKNFLSIGEEGIGLDYKEGLNVITGTNLDKNDSNGTGKSSLVEIIYFALFGDTLRELSNDSIPNYYTSSSCLCNVYFDIIDETGKKSYFVSRQLKPSKVFIKEMDDSGEYVDITKSTIPVNNTFIKSLISSGPEMFQNSVIMSVNSSVPFMMQNKVNKRKFLEDILGLQVFGEMMTIARKKFNEIKSEHSVNQTKYDTSKEGFTNIEELFKKYLESKDESEQVYKKRIEDCQKKIDDLKKESEKLQKEIDSCEKVETPSVLEDKISKLKELHTKIIKESSKISYEKDALNNELKKNKQKPEACPTCNRKFTDDLLEENKKRIEETASKITELETQLIEKTEKQKKISDALDSLYEEKQKYTVQIKELEQKRSSISYNTRMEKNILSDIDNHIKDIENLDKMTEEYETKLSKSKEELIKLQEKVDESKKQLEIYKSIKFIVSEEGIRAFVVKKILDLLNSKLNYYLNKMNANCTCSFDNNFNEVLINDKGKECSYYNFSAGERKRIDLAVLFTFQDIRRLQGNVYINISMYDELLDSSLDKSGIQSVLDILEERVENNKECVYIVTHRPDAIENISGEFIYLVKENGFTKYSD